MNRQLFVLGLAGVATLCLAAPAAAQSVLVDVGVHAGPIAGRVVYGAPGVHVYPGIYGVHHHRPYRVHRHRVHRHRHVQHPHRWHRAERRYHRRVHRLEHAHVRAHHRHSRHCRH